MNEINLYLENNKARMIEDLLKLIKQNTIYDTPSPERPYGNNIHSGLNYLENYVTSLGFTKIGRNSDHYLWIEVGPNDKEYIGIITHLDTVPIFVEEWNYSPFGEIHEKIIYGRGVSDDKGPVIQSIFALKYIEKHHPDVRVRLVVGCDEERDFNCAKTYITNEEMPIIGFVADAKFPYIISEKSIINMSFKIKFEDFGIPFKSIEAGKGTNIVPDYAKIVSLSNDTYEYFGKEAHIGNYLLGENAINKMIFEWGPKSENGSFFEKIFKLLMDNLLKYNFHGKEITINISEIKQNDKYMIITLDTRLPYELNVNLVRKEILEYFNVSENSIIRENYSQGYVYSRSNPVISCLEQVYKESSNKLSITRPWIEPLEIGGTTYAKLFPNCPSFGPGFPGERSYGHSSDERMTVNSFIDGTYVYILALIALSKLDLTTINVDKLYYL